jgi:hypothetical protein
MHETEEKRREEIEREVWMECNAEKQKGQIASKCLQKISPLLSMATIERDCEGEGDCEGEEEMKKEKQGEIDEEAHETKPKAQTSILSSFAPSSPSTSSSISATIIPDYAKALGEMCTGFSYISFARSCSACSLSSSPCCVVLMFFASLHFLVHFSLSSSSCSCCCFFISLSISVFCFLLAFALAAFFAFLLFLLLSCDE